MSTVFLTGFPGFLGSALVERLLERHGEETTVTCLIQSEYREEATTRRAEIDQAVDADASRIELVEGDITFEDLGLDNYDDVADRTDHVYHLAAIYDVTMDRAPGKAVNIDGTRNVVAFAGAADADRLHYVSTVVVAGDYEGEFTEEMLQEGQNFFNYYESTKHMAEVAVRERSGVPTTVYRPGVAVGDSESGETQKYDGPYKFLDVMDSQGSSAVVPVPWGAGSSAFNVVPRDFVVEAIAYLSGLDESAGKTYHIANPDPPTTTELVEAVADAMGKSRVFCPPYPKGIVAGLLQSAAVFGDEADLLESGSLEYQTWPASFDCSNTVEDLEGSGIECPDFEAYADDLVEFYQNNPEIGGEGMH